MSWYITGTVTCTNGSKVIIGVGTSWTAGVNAGDSFSLSDANGAAVDPFYEIASITDDTHLTLVRDYGGTTASGASYCITNHAAEQTSAALDRDVNALLSRLETSVAAAEKAKEWAIKTDGKVDNEDYSAKYYAAEAATDAATAQAAQTAAETAQGAAETAKTAAEVAKTGAETAKSGAEAAKDAAETSAQNAAVSETAALLGLSGATVFKGTLGTGGSITALPTADYLRGWTYRIVTAGTYAGVDYALGDLIIALSSFDTEFKNSDWIPVHIADEMNLKADVTYVDAELALKANIADVDDALALKADASDVADALALKADATDVMNALESSVNGNVPIFDGVTGDKLKDSGVKLSDKADVTYVEYLMMEGDPA